MTAKSFDLKCPVCASEAVYKYGHVKTGKQRLRCIMCGRQFVLGFSRPEPNNRPLCSKCGRTMHLYMHSKQAVRFRCSDYPDCKSYKKIPFKQEAPSHGMLCS